MSLTPTDNDNIEMLFNTTKEIYNCYCDFISLEQNKKTEDEHISKILNKMKLMENSEKNLILSFGEDIEKLKLVGDRIRFLSTFYNPYLSKRILIKLELYLTKLVFKKLIEVKKQVQERSQKQDMYYELYVKELMQEQYNQEILSDIFNIRMYYINNEIRGNHNNYIVNQLIDFKYKDMFLNLNNDQHIIDFYNIQSVDLRSDFSLNFMEMLYNVKYSKLDSEILKTLFIQKNLFSSAESLLKKDNASMTNDDEIIEAIILKSNIKACMCLLDDNIKKSIIDFLKKQESNGISKDILISSLDDSNKPIIKDIKLKIK